MPCYNKKINKITCVVVGCVEPKPKPPRPPKPPLIVVAGVPNDKPVILKKY